MTDLIKRGIDWSDLPKKALKIKDFCDVALSNYNKRKFDKPEKITLYDKDYKYLEEKLKENNQVLSECTYQGYPLVSEVPPVTRISVAEDEELYEWDEDDTPLDLSPGQRERAEKMLQVALERCGGDMNVRMVDVLSDDWNGGAS